MEENPAQPPIQTNTPTIPQNIVVSPKKSTNWKTIVFTAIFILAIEALGYFGYTYYQGQQKQSNNDQAENEKILVVLTPDPTGNWKTYENEDFRFKFKHPDLERECCGISGPTTQSPMLSITFADLDTVAEGTDKPFAGFGVYVVNSSLSFDKYIIQEKNALKSQFDIMSDAGQEHLGKQESFTLDDRTGTVLKSYSWDRIDRYYVPIPNSNNILVFSTSNTPSDKFTYDQILSTFKFANQEADGRTENWETNTNTSTYKVKYPSEMSVEEQDASTLVLYKEGPTQKKDAEHYDGISLRFQPFEIPNFDLMSRAKNKIQETIEAGLGKVISQPTEIKIGEYQGVTYTVQGLGIHKYTYLQSTDKIMFVEITDSTNDPSNQGFKKIVDKITSTFEFTHYSPLK